MMLSGRKWHAASGREKSESMLNGRGPAAPGPSARQDGGLDFGSRDGYYKWTPTSDKSAGLESPA